MAAKRDEKRKDLKDRLIAAATRRIETAGLRGLNARDVTRDAGCALGSLYTVLRDLDDLVMHVNSATLHRIGEAVAEAKAGVDDPVDLLKVLARSYLAFVRANYPLWIALFDYSAMTGVEIPDWHKQEQWVLIEHIAGPVRQLSPQLGDDEVAVRAKTLFAAVHGIISISVEDRFVGLPRENLEEELMRFVDQMVAGLNV